MKIVYIGIDLLYPALPALVAAGCEVLQIITCETDNETEFNISVCSYAKEHHIPLIIGKIKKNILYELLEEGCEALICGGYYYRIPVIPDLPMVNIHPSLLPEGRGAWPMPLVILNGQKETGVTIHKITAAFDEGDILLQRKIAVGCEDNLQQLTDKIQAVLPEMMKILVENFTYLYKEARPHEKRIYQKAPRENDYILHSGMSAKEADKILRAFYGYECIYREGRKEWGLIRGKVYRGIRQKKEDFLLADGYISADQIRKL